jgi:hypothetical protein
MRTTRPTVWVLLASLLAAAPAAAHHRQTPAILALTTSGDTPLPRVPAAGKKSLTLAVKSGADTQVVGISVFKTPDQPTVVEASGNNANPAISYTGMSFAWDTTSDPLNLGLPGHQVVLNLNGALLPVSNDPTGTSQNPSLDTVGLRVAFESEGDLANTGIPPASARSSCATPTAASSRRAAVSAPRRTPSSARSAGCWCSSRPPIRPTTPTAASPRSGSGP